MKKLVLSSVMTRYATLIERRRRPIPVPRLLKIKWNDFSQRLLFSQRRSSAMTARTFYSVHYPALFAASIASPWSTAASDSEGGLNLP
jgi:hypothetical protein